MPELLFTRFEANALPQVASQLDALLKWVTVGAAEVASTLDYTGYTAEEITAFFETASANPRPNQENWSEDGDVPGYMSSFLRQLRNVIAHAIDGHLDIVYKLEQPQGGGAETEADVQAKRKQQYESWLQTVGEEVGPEECRKAGCHRPRIRQSVMCRAHHYEMIRGQPWPFSDFS